MGGIDFWWGGDKNLVEGNFSRWEGDEQIFGWLGGGELDFPHEGVLQFLDVCDFSFFFFQIYVLTKYILEILVSHSYQTGVI